MLNMDLHSEYLHLLEVRFCSCKALHEYQWQTFYEWQALIEHSHLCLILTTTLQGMYVVQGSAFINGKNEAYTGLIFSQESDRVGFKSDLPSPLNKLKSTLLFLKMFMQQEQAFGLRIKIPCPTLECLGSNPSSSSWPQPSASVDPEAQQWWLRWLGFCLPHGRLAWIRSSWLWPQYSHGHCSHLGCEPADRNSLLSFSLCLLNLKNKNVLSA